MAADTLVRINATAAATSWCHVVDINILRLERVSPPGGAQHSKRTCRSGEQRAGQSREQSTEHRVESRAEHRSEHRAEHRAEQSKEHRAERTVVCAGAQ